MHRTARASAFIILPCSSSSIAAGAPASSSSASPIPSPLSASAAAAEVCCGVLPGVEMLRCCSACRVNEFSADVDP